MASGGNDDNNSYNIHKVSCDKNNHEGYITPIPICLTQIKERFRSTDLHNLISSQCSLTVKVLVKSRSKKRLKEKSQETTSEIICQEFQGSGRILEMKDCSCDFPCQNCLSECKSKMICIQTCNHLVFDEHEANHTECILFFDGPDAHPKTLKNGKLIDYDTERDTSILAFKLCDNSVIAILEKELSKFTVFSNILQRKYVYVKDEDRLCVIVSHPHGCFKCVAFGTWDVADGYFTYTAETCPASSGGSVFLLGVNSNDLIHRGVCPSGKNCTSLVERPVLCCIETEKK